MRNFVVTVRMDQEFHALLKACAERDGKSMNAYCLDSLTVCMDSQEEFEQYDKSQQAHELAAT